jgi:hypothetical protein
MTDTATSTETATFTETPTQTGLKFDFNSSQRVDTVDLLLLFSDERVPDATEMFEFSFYWFESLESK